MFRPCIDLHQGQVKQIVGATLTDDASPQTNFASERPAEWYAELYRRDGLAGGHVIMLGPDNEAAALAAIQAYPQGLQVGGGITPANATTYLDAGAAQVIVTSYVFHDGRLDRKRLEKIAAAVGRDRLVLDLSCRKKDEQYLVVTDRWQKWTDLPVNEETLCSLDQYCSEFLIHAVDREGHCNGIDLELVKQLARACPLPVTYAGGARSLQDLADVHELSNGRVDLTIGSALDIFGGDGVRYKDAVAFNHRILQARQQPGESA